MRLWTLHPKYLDRQGLLALWREALLAQQVLLGQTRGYRAHPQLTRFREQAEPLASLAAYLHGIYAEALWRSYCFDATKIQAEPIGQALVVEAQGQLLFEWEHLLRKLQARSPSLYEQYRAIEEPLPHPLFCIVPGPIASWERGAR